MLKGSKVKEYIQFSRTAVVDTIVRLKNSRNGNPRYLIAFTDGIVGKTKTDAGFVYGIHDGLTVVNVKFHFTPKGHCVIEDMEGI
jgi:hypothetical protein